YSGTRGIAREVGLAGPIACVDGSHIVDVATDRELYVRAIEPASTAEVRAAVERHDLAAFLFAQDGIVHDEGGAPFAPYVSTWSDQIAVVERVTEHPFWDHERGVMAVVAIGLEAALMTAAREIRERAPDAAVVTFPVARLGGTCAMVVRAEGTTKGTAVRWLAGHYACSAAEVVVVGDWINDVPMFDAAGCSFVMKQAPEAVKRRATHELEADADAGGGVAEAIRRAFGV
ncbi:MAG TPA: HAD hydrolase family protein, partial [Minicystis sp.]|nr:HAD hydrolase family protein [Minicystis sp.]